MSTAEAHVDLDLPPSRPRVCIPTSSSQSTETRRTPAQYLAAITVHSERNKDSFLYPGVNYRYLAQFLKRSSQCPFDRGTGRSPPAPHTFVSIHNFRSGGDKMVTEFDSVSGLEAFRNDSKSDPASGNLILMRGYPSPDWLHAIGAQFKVDPDFYLRHLDFMRYRDFYNDPGLQSSYEHFVQLKITTICTRRTAITRDQIKTARECENESIKKFQQKLGADGRVGESIVRRFSTHNENTFTIEQDMSCYVKTINSKCGWTAGVWLDCGMDLTEGPVGPWQMGLSSDRFECMPVIQHKPMLALKSQPNDHLLGTTENMVNSPKLPCRARNLLDTLQSARLLHTLYGQFQDTSFMSTDAMFALNELFVFAANSECQFLNFMAARVWHEIKTFENHMKFSLANLRYSKELIDSHVSSLARVVTFLKNCKRDCHCDGKPPQRSETAEKAGDALLNDYEDLLSRARNLSALCVEGANDISTSALLDESSKAVEGSERIKRLTLLAFLFLPLSLATSIFGMNFKEFGTGKMSVWAFLPLAFILFSSSMFLAFPTLVQRLMPKKVRKRAMF